MPLRTANLLPYSDSTSGLHAATQRRWVTPFVLLLNFSGHKSEKSRNSPSRSNREWSSATPFTVVMLRKAGVDGGDAAAALTASTGLQIATALSR